jgi:small subunit ribosomal protein S16
MLIIRLQRSGKINKAEYRIILAEKQAAANKKFIEVLGHYNPRTKSFAIKEDRLQYWVGQHVSFSPTVHNLFVTKELIKEPKVKAFSVPKKPAEVAAAEAPATEQAKPEEAVPEVAAETPAEPVEEEVKAEEVAVKTPVEAPTEEKPAEPAA